MEQKKIKKDDLILADGEYYSMDCYKTQLNNNVLVVGAAGSGKTRSIVTPNILQASGSYVITDPKGLLYKKYGDYLRTKGYKVKVVDFINPGKSDKYNPISYIRSTQDVQKLAHMMIDGSNLNGFSRVDPFWDESSEVLLTALLHYLWQFNIEEDKTFDGIFKLLASCDVAEYNREAKTTLDRIFDAKEKRNPNDFGVRQYKKFRVGAGKTLCSVLISLGCRLGRYDTEELRQMMSRDEICLGDIGREKTAVFVIISDRDRAMDGLANIFYGQAMDELCRVADEECEDGRLPIPVRFILDDFATNCKITDFPRMISSIRSRGISTMLMLQAESQLEHCYGRDGYTIIASCDNYVYLGGNDVETANAIAKRCNIPIGKVLYMPIGTNFIFRRGQQPINGNNFNLEPFEEKCLKTLKSYKKSKRTVNCEENVIGNYPLQDFCSII